MTTSSILFFDGSCGYCNNVVRFVLRHERDHTLRFATLQGPSGKALARRHPSLRDFDSVVLVECSSHADEEVVFTRSDAALRISKYLSGMWRLGSLALLIPRRLRNAMYDLVARHRHLLVRGADGCPVVDAENRSRFLDADTYP